MYVYKYVYVFEHKNTFMYLNIEICAYSMYENVRVLWGGFKALLVEWLQGSFV